jgi:hypothetical protein
VACLVLAVCDVRGRFIYVSAGAPSTVGDAGLWARSDLFERIEQGLLSGVTCELEVDGELRSVTGYLVGDSAFSLGPAMQKIYDGPPPAGQAAFVAAGKDKYNRCLINARRTIECSFGRLKGRFVFCARNMFVQSPEHVRCAVRVCCGLHNFLEERGVEYDVNVKIAHAELNVHTNVDALAIPEQGAHGSWPRGWPCARFSPNGCMHACKECKG